MYVIQHLTYRCAFKKRAFRLLSRVHTFHCSGAQCRKQTVIVTSTSRYKQEYAQSNKPEKEKNNKHWRKKVTWTEWLFEVFVCLKRVSRCIVFFIRCKCNIKFFFLKNTRRCCKRLTKSYCAKLCFSTLLN